MKSSKRLSDPTSLRATHSNNKTLQIPTFTAQSNRLLMLDVELIDLVTSKIRLKLSEDHRSHGVYHRSLLTQSLELSAQGLGILHHPTVQLDRKSQAMISTSSLEQPMRGINSLERLLTRDSTSLKLSNHRIAANNQAHTIHLELLHPLSSNPIQTHTSSHRRAHSVLPMSRRLTVEIRRQAIKRDMESIRSHV